MSATRVSLSRKIQLCGMDFWLWCSVWPSSYTNWLSRPELIYVRDILQNGCVKLHLLSQSQFFGIPTRWRLCTNSNQSSRYTYLVQIGWPPASDMYLTMLVLLSAKLQTWFIFFCHDWSNLFGHENWVKFVTLIYQFQRGTIFSCLKHNIK